ncbi:hypothetical protein [Melittangium boletus]|uniref:Lipoprotein n=1 Tax=Melittangium boletus DSM 14713 TaxID=1294270 RepID=A0A250IR10_9BACT|nr:hypothetical protein [Melittangium boletus]ATB33617.1 hypothetical protein MEBOL_007115 [Melittangium boletus DSM 14713]
MKERATKTRSTWRLAGFLLVLGVALGAHAEPPSSNLPGRKPDTSEPWGAFLGRAAHEAIGRQYRVQHPTHAVFLDTVNLSTIVEEGRLGDPERLSKFARRLRPDITDTRALVLFEIKPDNEDGRKEGRAQAGRYLAALNAAVEPHKQLSGGTGFDGSLFIEFENGGALWQLSWRTPEPGVTLYRWSYRRKQPNASWKERAAQKEEALPREEIEQRGGWVEQALRAAYERGDWPSGFQGQVYLPVDCR